MGTRNKYKLKWFKHDMQTLDFIRYCSNLPSARPRNKKPALGTRTLTQIVDLSFRGRLWANSYWKSHGHAQQRQTQMVRI